jgi:chromosome segregation protein
MGNWDTQPFSNGNTYVRADFHLHTKADKEFRFDGADDRFVSEYVENLKQAGIRVGLITNHNKFDFEEFKALKKKARKEGICMLPGVELSVNDGSNGIHTLISFSDQWLEGGQDYINQFLGVAFSGKVPAQYEQENGRCNFNLQQTLETLESYHKDFFIVFAHVEARSGLWSELAGGRMQELGENPLIKRHCKAFQKVRTYDRPDSVCREKVKQWWPNFYPAEVEGSDPKSLDQIGKGRTAYLKIGELSYGAVRYALTDYLHRVSNDPLKLKHSFLKSIRFEGGFLDGKKIELNSQLNCLIGIRGSGKSAILESLRYAVSIPHGETAQDKKYKELLLPFVLKSGGKIIVEAVDRYGTNYEIHRILKEDPEVFVEGKLTPNLSISGTIITKPLYFGQKDLSVAGEGFGQDLVDKLIGEQVHPFRQAIKERTEEMLVSIQAFQQIVEESEQKKENESELRDVDFKIEQLEKHGIQDKLSKRVAFDEDIEFCARVSAGAASWASEINHTFEAIEDILGNVQEYTTQYNQEFIDIYKAKCLRLFKSIRVAKIASESAGKTSRELAALRKHLEFSKDSLKNEFAEIERSLVHALEAQGIKSIELEDYFKLTKRKTELIGLIEDLGKKTERLNKAKEDLSAKLTGLNTAWKQEFVGITDALKVINESQDALHVEVKYQGNKEAFASKMEDTFRGKNLRKQYYQSLASIYQDFGEIYKNLDVAVELVKSGSEIFKEIFKESLADLLAFQVPHSYEITYHGKPLKSHSLGQRASAMMLFILSQKDSELLLIDQPEDDLDNQTIYEDVVKLLRMLKLNQQFIFATHNANFPVLGDAENICSCSFTDDQVVLESGSVDSKNMQEKIVAIMEGGKEAFDRRKMIYQTWKALGESVN